MSTREYSLALVSTCARFCLDNTSWKYFDVLNEDLHLFFRMSYTENVYFKNMFRTGLEKSENLP